MAPSLSDPSIVLSFSLLLLVFPFSLASNIPSSLTYHGGPLLTGNITLTLIWYGQVGNAQKKVIRSFVNSLNFDGQANLQPQVSSWWNVVESYQEVAGKGRGPIHVKVVKQLSDKTYSLGKVITVDFLKPLVEKATGGDPNTIPVIFTSRQVKVHGLCMGKCSDHGFIGNKPYLVVGNPETECPGACAWPFHKAEQGPVSVTLNPPNGNVGADAMVMALAQGLAEIVTNPLKTGFFQEHIASPIEAGSACHGVFGSGAFAGYTGKVRVDPANGGGFNAHGARGRKFLVPAIWNPKTKACWTLT